MRVLLALFFCAAHALQPLIDIRTQSVPKEYPYHSLEMSPFHPKIHTLSNVGKRGALHASGAVVATKIIDILAYKGRNIRYEIAKEVYEREKKRRKLSTATTLSVVDVGCSVGVFTKALWDAGFSKLAGIDSSPEMLYAAKEKLPDGVQLLLGNAGMAVPPANVIVCGFVMHELPEVARRAIIKEAYNALDEDGAFVVVDIDRSYLPREMMLAGEPFCLDYLKNFARELEDSPFHVEAETWVTNHVGVWWCTKKPT